jgi:ribosomal protein S10
LCCFAPEAPSSTINFALQETKETLSHYHCECNCVLHIVSAKPIACPCKEQKNIPSRVECDSINETASLNGRWTERYEIIIHKTCLKIHKIKK